MLGRIQTISIPLVLLVIILLMTIGAGGVQATPVASVPASVPVYEQKNLKAYGFFYAGGHYVGEEGKKVMQGQMYVEVFVPKQSTHPYPLVFFHGASSTGVTWKGTPDGREGWADYFIEQGYVVYLVDQPARGRSAYNPGVDGRLAASTVKGTELNTTADGTWPRADKHTQWPGDGPNKGHMGDSVFDSYYASKVAFLASNAETQQLVQDAGAALLDEIGPAILVTHSQAGAFGWLIADARPQLVKGIVALEPLGPPYRDAGFYPGAASRTRAWGITDIPLAYDPPVSDPAQLTFVQVPTDKPVLLPEAGWLQQEPARQLPNLQGIPILIVSTEASYHSGYDEWTARYLAQAGVKNTYIRLEDYGFRGNAHNFMVEKNNLEIASFLNKWMVENLK